MKERSDEELKLRRYLLGDLDETMMDEVEVCLLRDSKYADRLSAAEDNLIDDYVFEALSEPERERFNTNFLVNDERRNKILIARAMEVYVGEHPAKHPIHHPLMLSQLWHNSIRFLQGHKLSVVFTVLIIVLLAVFVSRIIRSRAWDDQIARVSTQHSDVERIKELNRQNNPIQPALQITLQPLVLRENSEIARLVLTRDPTVIGINLQLPPGNRFEEYRAVLQTVEGSQLFAIDHLKAGEGIASRIVPLKLTGDVLSQGDYQIQLMGSTSENIPSEVARYNLRVIQ
jgi:hypothetical protein